MGAWQVAAATTTEETGTVAFPSVQREPETKGSGLVSGSERTSLKPIRLI